MIKIAVIREGKIPIDERVPLTPAQVVYITNNFREIDMVVQSSAVRRIGDEEYSALGIRVVPEVAEADVMMGVKEVPVDQLVPGKTYMFFSHTIKKQHYNKKLLQAILAKRIRLIDWECLRDTSGQRLIGFGRYAGIVGTYNAFRAYGLRSGRYDLPRAHDCRDRADMESQLDKADLPPIKILLTGKGKVANGAMEILDLMKIRKVNVEEYLGQQFDEPVYCQITYTDYYKPPVGEVFDVKKFHSDPSGYSSDFMRFAVHTDVYIAGHFWASNSPYIYTQEDTRQSDFRISVVADISCDVGGPIASTIRASSIDAPFYGYDPATGKECPIDAPGAIMVMAVDNLPCELPRDASHDFGEVLIRNVLPLFVNGDKDDILRKATIAEEGEITAPYAYLREWVAS